MATISNRMLFLIGSAAAVIAAAKYNDPSELKKRDFQAKSDAMAECVLTSIDTMTIQGKFSKKTWSDVNNLMYTYENNLRLALDIIRSVEEDREMSESGNRRALDHIINAKGNLETMKKLGLDVSGYYEIIRSVEKEWAKNHVK